MIEPVFRRIYYFLSPKMRLFVRKVVFFPIDVYESSTKRRSKYVPKKGDIFIGSGDFVNQGDSQLMLLKELTNISPESTVLDVGCGIGRTALPLTNFLNKKGIYEGFDVVAKGINWCTEKISKDFPNFTFKHISLQNDLYSSNGENATTFSFPYEDDTFDEVFLFSVFTHMQETEVQNYLKEISRTLKLNGKCLATFFIYNSENEEEISFSNKSFNFPVKKEGFRLMNSKVKSANISFNISNLTDMAGKSNLKIDKFIPGHWSKTNISTEFNQFQDIVLFSRLK